MDLKENGVSVTHILGNEKYTLLQTIIQVDLTVEEVSADSGSHG